MESKMYLPLCVRRTSGASRKRLRGSISSMSRVYVHGVLVVLTMAGHLAKAFLPAPSMPSRYVASRTRESTSATMAYDVRYSPNSWKDEGDIEPGFGGIWPGDPNAKKYNVKYVNKKGETMISVDVPEDRYIFFATEETGVDVPIINKKRMCRNGCCTTCAVKVLEGKIKAEGALGLLRDLKQEGWALSCSSYPRSDLVVQLQEEDEVYLKQFGENFEGGGVEWGGVFPDED